MTNLNLEHLINLTKTVTYNHRTGSVTLRQYYGKLDTYNQIANYVQTHLDASFDPDSGYTWRDGDHTYTLQQVGDGYVYFEIA